MKPRVTVICALVASGCCALFAFTSRHAAASRDRPPSPAGLPPQTISASVAKYREQRKLLRAVGTLQAVRGVEISGQVGGLVSSIHFNSGSEVKKGALLVQLADNDEIAKLQALKAIAALSKLTYDRDLLQLRVQGVSQQVVDADRQMMRRDNAQVSEQQALIEYKSIRSPFSGGLGIRRVNIGQYIQAGTPIVTLQQLDPIYVDFYVPQQDFGQVRVGQNVVTRVDAYPSRQFPGAISAINRKVDASSRNVQIQATLRNEDHALVPGMFATVEVHTDALERDIVVPATAINYSPYGNTVFVLESREGASAGKEGMFARESIVVTGAAQGDQIAILRGIREGQLVVSAGQSKLTDGVPVSIDNTVTPSESADPNPLDE